MVVVAYALLPHTLEGFLPAMVGLRFLVKPQQLTMHPWALGTWARPVAALLILIGCGWLAPHLADPAG